MEQHDLIVCVQAAARLQATQPGWQSQTQHKGSNVRHDGPDADTLPEGFQLQVRLGYGLCWQAGLPALLKYACTFATLLTQVFAVA